MKVPALLGDHKIIGPLNPGTVVFHNRSWVMLGAPKIHKQMPKPHDDVFDRRTKDKVLSLHSRGSDCPLKPGGPNNRGIPKKKNIARY